MKIIGFDPGLRRTGWGIIEAEDNRLRHIANGVVTSDSSLSMAQRLVQLHQGMNSIIEKYRPLEAAVEEVFVNKNPASTLKLGQARGIALLVSSMAGLTVGEYSPNLIKKTVVGSGHAAKQQVQMMVKTLLPGCDVSGPDAADALAVAICHAQHRMTAVRIEASENRIRVVAG